MDFTLAKWLLVAGILNKKDGFPPLLPHTHNNIVGLTYERGDAGVIQLHLLIGSIYIQLVCGWVKIIEQTP